MQREGRRLLFVLWMLGVAQGLQAGEVKPVEGTFSINKQTYKLTHAVAYSRDVAGQEMIVVLVSDRRIPIDALKAAIREGNEAEERILGQPQVMVVFSKSGEVDHYSAWAENSSSYAGAGSMSAELILENGRARGKAKLKTPGEGVVQRNFDFQFDLPVGLDVAEKPVNKRASPAKASVSGAFKGNGKPAKLTYVSARRGEPFDDKPSLLLILTEKDHSKDKRPDITAAFGSFGSALILSVFENGQIFGCEVAHSAHGKKPFSSLGSIKTDGFELRDGQVSGRITTDGNVKNFDDTWEVDLTFAVPFAEVSAKAVAKKHMPAENQPATNATKDDAEHKPKVKDAVAAPSARSLPLPKDATDIEFKELVEQIVFKSPLPVQTLAADLTKALAAQGWTKDENDDDLVNAKSAIMKRMHSKASVSIMLKPADKGSQGIIFTEGLKWDEKAASP